MYDSARAKPNLANETVGLQITTREFDRVIVVDVVGKLTIGESRTQLRDLIHMLSGTGHKKFLLNLAGVDYVDSDGMGELVRCFTTVRQRGGEMKLVKVNKRVADLLQMTRLNTLFEIYGGKHSVVAGEKIRFE